MAIVLQRGKMMMEKFKLFKSGTSGLVLAEPNKKAYPPAYRETSRLTYYASVNNSIEINSSFYKIPRGRTFADWSDQVPDDFKFTVKLWRGITHEKSWSAEDLNRFMLAADRLGEKKGCLLIQFPAKTSYDSAAVQDILQAVKVCDPSNGWKIAVEFRHSKWYHPGIDEMLNAFNAGLVLHDMPGSVPEAANPGSPFFYYRFHGEKGDYRGSYSDEHLRKIAVDIRHLLEQEKEVYAYFNNTIGDAVANLKTLRKMVLE